MNPEPHARTLRSGRHSQAGGVYLITMVTANRHPWFADFDAARALIHTLHHPDMVARAQTWAYVVMPDHVHWLMHLGQLDGLSACVQRFKSMATKRLGHALWQKGFHDHALRREEDLHAIARYVVANPVRAGLVQTAGAYPHWDAIWI